MGKAPRKTKIWCYSFAPRFARAIVAGDKLHTIQRERRDRLRPEIADQLHLYTREYRNRKRLLSARLICEVSTVLLDWRSLREPIWRNGEPLSRSACEALAVGEGFRDLEAMQDYYAREQGPTLEGILVRWSTQELILEEPA